MKRWIAMMMALAMILSLAACGGSSSDGPPEPYVPETQMTQDEMEALAEKLMQQFKEDFGDESQKRFCEQSVTSPEPLTLDFAMEFWLPKQDNFQFEDELLHLFLFRINGEGIAPQDNDSYTILGLCYDMDTGILYHTKEPGMEYEGMDTFPTKEDVFKMMMAIAMNYDGSSPLGFQGVEAKNVLQQPFIDSVNENVVGMTQQEVQQEQEEQMASVDWQIEPIPGELTEDHKLVWDVANRFLEEKGRGYLDYYQERIRQILPIYISDAAIYQFPAESGYPEKCLLIKLSGGFAWDITQDRFAGNEDLCLLYNLDSGALYDSSVIQVADNGQYTDEGNPIYACMIDYWGHGGDGSTDRLATQVTILVRSGAAQEDIVWEPEPLTGTVGPEHQQILDVVDRFLQERGIVMLDGFYRESGDVMSLSISHAALYQFPEDSLMSAKCLLINLKGGFLFGDGIYENVQLLYDLDTGKLYDSTTKPQEINGSPETQEEAIYLCLNTFSNITWGGEIAMGEETITILVRDGAAVKE